MAVSVAEERYTAQEEILAPLLQQVIGNDRLHADWLNVLSYLEYIGSRKIFKTQNREVIDEHLLRHAADEARHALLLKQLIEKLKPGSESRYERDQMLAGFPAFRYFQSLDATVKRALAPERSQFPRFSYVCYVYVSYIIEVRANWLYRIYAAELERAGSVISVKSIINDEVRHLADMQKEIMTVDPTATERIELLLDREDRLFQRFLGSLQKNLS